MIQRIMIADYNQLLNTPIENKDLSSFWCYNGEIRAQRSISFRWF